MISRFLKLNFLLMLLLIFKNNLNETIFLQNILKLALSDPISVNNAYFMYIFEALIKKCYIVLLTKRK